MFLHAGGVPFESKTPATQTDRTPISTNKHIFFSSSFLDVHTFWAPHLMLYGSGFWYFLKTHSRCSSPLASRNLSRSPSSSSECDWMCPVLWLGGWVFDHGNPTGTDCSNGRATAAAHTHDGAKQPPPTPLATACLPSRPVAVSPALAPVLEAPQAAQDAAVQHHGGRGPEARCCGRAWRGHRLHRLPGCGACWGGVRLFVRMSAQVEWFGLWASINRPIDRRVLLGKRTSDDDTHTR